MASDLFLLRLVSVTFAPPPASGEKFSGDVDGVWVMTLASHSDEQRLQVLFAAELNLPYRPKVTKENLVVVPEAERVRLERALETFANTLSVLEECSRSIASPFPSVAFRTETAEGRAWLKARTGIHRLSDVTHIATLATPIALEDKPVQEAIADRPDGIALLAEVYAQSHALGRYRDLVRFFERAFSLAPSKLQAPLVQFLDARYAYTPDEIGSWIKVRDPATHSAPRKTFALERDARPLLPRMEQAARDVLFNKALWGDPSLARRETWEPTAWTVTQKGRGQATSGLPMRAGIQVTDPFDAYPAPFDLHLSISGDLWCPTPSQPSARTPLNVTARNNDSEQQA